jgi:replicative DNA helicase
MNNQQPNDINLERAILGAIMLDSQAINQVSDVLRPGMCYASAHNEIYQAQCDLFAEGERIDMLTVTQRLKKNGTLEKCGGPVYLVDLANQVASAANIEAHARIVFQKFLRRSLITFGSKTIQAALDESTDDFEPLAIAEKGLFEISGGLNMRGSESIGRAAMKSLKIAEIAAGASGGVVGIPTNIHSVDKITGGWRNSDLIILAARPGMGKTAFVLNCAYEAAVSGKAVGFFSLEMSADQLATRAMCAACGVDSQRIRNGSATKSDMEAIANEAHRFQSIPIYIDDTPGVTIFQLRSAARRMKTKHGISLLVVDYLQLMSGGGQKGQNREQEISEIARGLKHLAKELDIPIIALSQLSRSVETRGGTKRPILSDLRESGAIEQDADIVGFIYRPEYYDIIEDEKGRSLKGIAELIFAKHRSGPLDTALMRWTESLTKFSNLDGFDSTQPSSQFPAAVPSAREIADRDIPF